MSSLTRRSALGLLGAAMLAGCSGVTDYSDRGPKNLELVLKSAEGGFLTSRSVFVDVWSGPKGPNMEYLGTKEFLPGGNSIGLPVGQPTHLALAFEENQRLGGQVSTSTVEIPMKALRSGEAYRITVSFDRIGFTHDMQRIR